MHCLDPASFAMFAYVVCQQPCEPSAGKDGPRSNSSHRRVASEHVEVAIAMRVKSGGHQTRQRASHLTYRKDVIHRLALENF